MLFSSVAAFIGIAASLAPSALAWGGPATHDVQVGPNGQLVFDPMTLEATWRQSGSGMVLGINPGAPGTNNSFQDFQDIALAIGVALKAEAEATAADAAGLAAYSSIESTAAAA